MSGQRQYECPGITTPQPPDAPAEGFVACWRAGHECPPDVALVETERGYRTTSYRCPCCGEHGVTYCVPVAWLS